MKQQKKIKGGVSVQEVQVIPNFSGKTIYYAINYRGSEILLDREQVKQYEELMSQEKKVNLFEEAKIPASLFTKPPENITKKQIKIQEGIRDGNQKPSQITQPGSCINPSIILQNQFCFACEPLSQDQQRQIENLREKNNYLSKQLDHLNTKVGMYQKQIKDLQEEKQKMMKENQQLKKVIQGRKSFISLKSSFRSDKCQEDKLDEKSKALKANLVEKIRSSLSSISNPMVSSRKDQSIVLLEVQTQNNYKARLSVLSSSIIQQVKEELDKNKQESQQLVGTFMDVVSSVNQYSSYITLSQNEYKDMVGE